MTMTVQVGIVSSVSDELDLVALEVTEHGAWREVFRLNSRDRNTSLPESIWAERALLLCEGYHDFSDGVSADDEYGVRNPLIKFLQREHPHQSLKDELRQRISKLEEENLSLRRSLDEANARVTKMRKAIAE